MTTTNLHTLIFAAQIRQREREQLAAERRQEEEAKRNDALLLRFRQTLVASLGADFLELGTLQIAPDYGPGLNFSFCGFSYGLFFERQSHLTQYWIIRRETEDRRILAKQVLVTVDTDVMRDSIFCAIAELAGLAEEARREEEA